MAPLATFTRICTEDLDATLAGLAASGISTERLRFGHATGLQLVLVGDVLVIAGTADQLAQFRGTDLTVIVADLDEALAAARAAGAEVHREPARQVTGRNVTVAFGDALVVEYVEWNDDTRQAAGLA